MSRPYSSDMTWQFRKSKTSGPLRATLSKGGVGFSAGAGPLRYGVGADGKTRRTLRVPGTGVYATEVIGEDQDHGATESAPTESAPTEPKRRHPWLVALAAASLLFLLVMLFV